ncbi:MAG: EamA/RhaT family transporter, partial [Candidatus Puniceispirillaceae bacterium]
AVTVTGGMATVASGWQAPSPSSWSLMGGAALAIPAAYVLSIATMRVGDVSFVTPFRYTAVVFATILSCLLTGRLPDGLFFWAQSW